MRGARRGRANTRAIAAEIGKLFPTVRMYLWDHLVSVDGEKEYVFLNIAALKAIKGKFPELRYDRATRKFVRREDGE